MCTYVSTGNNCNIANIDTIYKRQFSRKEIILALSLSPAVVCFFRLHDLPWTSCQMYHPSFDYGALCDNVAIYNNDKYYRPSYFSKRHSRLRKFSVRAPRANPFLIPARDGVKFLTIRISRARGREEIVFHFTYTISSYDGNQHVDRGNARAVAVAARRKDIPRALPSWGWSNVYRVNPIFAPHEVVNPRSLGRTSVNIDVNLEERSGRERERITQGPRETRRGEANLIRGGSDGN